MLNSLAMKLTRCSTLYLTLSDVPKRFCHAMNINFLTVFVRKRIFYLSSNDPDNFVTWLSQKKKGKRKKKVATWHNIS